MDLLTTGDWDADQQRFLAQNPILLHCAAVLREAQRRALDTDGLHTVRRLIGVMRAATCGLAPDTRAPIAQRIVYTYARRAMAASLLAVLQARPRGGDGPVLTQAALDALTRLEQCDPATDDTSTRVADLAFVLDNLSWRLT